jgi:beta-glucosidase
LVLHKTAGSYAESGAHAINGGLDVIFQTDVNHYKLFYPAFTNNSINQQRLDDAVKRVLRAKFELGLFENPYISEDINEEKAHSEGKTLARKVAQESFVLLKNENAVLPLLGEAQTIAVIGIDATEARLGGYSGPGFQKVNILDGIKEQAGDAEVLYTEGVGRNSIEHELVKCAFNADYFDNLELKGAPVLTREEEKVDGHWTLFSPNEKLKVDHFSVRWTGEFTSPASGEFEIGLEGNDGFRLYVNDELIINRWLKQSYRKELVKYNFKKRKKYKIRVEFFESQGEGKIRLISNLFMKDDSEKKLSEAVKTVKKADIAVVVVGIEEGEFRDRASLKLPGKQEEMIKAIAATGKPVVVLIVGGSAVNMNAWVNDVDAIGMLWYPGEEGGRAVADVLFGRVNPAGRLPITFPLDEAQLPLVYNHEPTGRGNDYNNLSGQPLFPFGFGLSYTTFSYSDIELEKTVIGTSESTKVRLKVKNTGAVDGDEVVQLYIQDELSSVVRAVLELKGFQRIHLKAGEEKELEFKITPEMLSQLDLELNSFVEAGIFRIMIGGSSRDLRLKTELEVK